MPGEGGAAGATAARALQPARTPRRHRRKCAEMACSGRTGSASWRSTLIAGSWRLRFTTERALTPRAGEGRRSRHSSSSWALQQGQLPWGRLYIHLCCLPRPHRTPLHPSIHPSLAAGASCSTTSTRCPRATSSCQGARPPRPPARSSRKSPRASRRMSPRPRRQPPTTRGQSARGR